MSIRAYIKNDLSAIFQIYNHSKLDELKFESTVFTLLPLEKDKARYSGLIESEIYVYQAEIEFQVSVLFMEMKFVLY